MRPRPRAAPETRTTLSVRLNSGNSLVVSRTLDGTWLFCKFCHSVDRGEGGLRPGVCGGWPLGGFSNVKGTLKARHDVKDLV